MLAANVRKHLNPFPALRHLARLTGAGLLSLALVAGPALAKDHGDGHGQGHGRGEGQGQGHGRGGGWGHGDDGQRGHGWGHGDEQRGRGEWRGGYDDYGGPPGRGGGRWGYAPPAEAYVPYPGAPVYPGRPPAAYGLRRGEMMPPEYRGAIVPDYGRHRLRPPPPGFAWVRMGDRYMLVSRSTGQIFDVIGQ
jgi:Ni/Co efflux regulator RcnB